MAGDSPTGVLVPKANSHTHSLDTFHARLGVVGIGVQLAGSLEKSVCHLGTLKRTFRNNVRGVGRDEDVNVFGGVDDAMNTRPKVTTFVDRCDLDNGIVR